MSRAVQLVLLSVVILTCLQIGVAHVHDIIVIMVNHYFGSTVQLLCFVGANLSAAVHEILLPIMKEIKNDFNSVKDDLSSVKNDLSSLNKTVINLSKDLVDHKQQTTSEATCTGILPPLDCCQVHVSLIYAIMSAYLK